MSLGPTDEFIKKDETSNDVTIGEEEQKMLLDDNNDEYEDDGWDDSKIVICRYWNGEQELNTNIETVKKLSKESIIKFMTPKNPFILESLYCYLRNAYIKHGTMYHLDREVLQCSITTGMMLEGEIKHFNKKSFVNIQILCMIIAVS